MIFTYCVQLFTLSRALPRFLRFISRVHSFSNNSTQTLVDNNK